MLKNPSGISALDWRELVEETLRRRKAEKMTQKEHAALAGVSIPTIVAFDRGEWTLTLAKAFDILRVVGLVEEQGEDGAHDIFVQDAFKRWRDLTSKLPENSSGRMPHGFYRIDYWLEGDLEDVELPELYRLMEKAEIKNTGWPMFVTMTRPEFEPQEVDGVLESWIKPGDAGVERMIHGAAHCDFWRAAPSGRLFLIRGYEEDGQETFPPATILDTTLPIWRLGEGLLHAARLARLMARDQDSGVTVHFRVLYSGLSGRLLRSWAKPLLGNINIEGSTARSDEAVLETVIPATDIEADLARCVYPLAASLYERFGVSRLSSSFVAGEIESFLQRPATGGVTSARTPRRFQPGDIVKLKAGAYNRFKENFDIDPEEQGTVTGVEDHPPPTGPTYRIEVRFPPDRVVPYTFESAYELVKPVGKTK